MCERTREELLRALPQVQELLAHPSVDSLSGRFEHHVLLEACRAAVAAVREQILDGQAPEFNRDMLAADAARRALALSGTSLRRAINASGVIIHTNLGRSVLAKQAVAAVDDAIAGYSTLEYDTETMSRGSRHDHCEKLICALTGAQAAIAVNNNAAAVLMVLSEFAADGQAVVSRGELIEIGGSFRIPDIMELSHARMVEVGTTNKTHPSDYERALGDETRMLLKVHPSNYRMLGFTEDVGVARLRAIADAHNARCNGRVLVYEDQGSGAFAHMECFGSYAEPTIARSLADGADLVSFSGDKLLGGPQAGIIVGSRELIERLKASPLARVLRLDKMSLAALEATLRLYLQPERAMSEIPTLRMLNEPASAVHERARRLEQEMRRRLPEGCATLELVEEVSRAGGGALPMCDIPTWALCVGFLLGDAQECRKYLEQQRQVPVVCRISHEHVLCDCRTLVDEDETGEVAAAFAAYFAFAQARDGLEAGEQIERGR